MARVIPIKTFTSWSFSRYSDYRRCPLAAKLKHLDKIAEPKNPAMERGAQVHNLAEDYLKGKVAQLAPELKAFEREFKQLRELYKRRLQPMAVEDTWAFTASWTQTRWDDWVGCWVRIKLDCAHQVDGDVMVITDWKTGKFRPELHEEYLEQLELYALGALLIYPHVRAATPFLAYTDEGKVHPERAAYYERSDVERLKTIWGKRVGPMFKDRTFAPRPNDKCKWCWYGQSKKAAGGPGLCKY